MSLASAFDALIDPTWQLVRTDSFWQLQEPGSPHSLVEGLFRLHGHWRGQYRFFGIISLKPRRQEKKGTTRRSAELPQPETCPYGYPVFTLTNHPRVFLPDLIHKLGNSV